MDRDTRLGLLASAILDGTPVDWHDAGSSADATERSVVRKLQILSEIAALHRQPDESTLAVPPPRARDAQTWGHLRLLEPIGRGTFGQVYRAWDPHLDREVALKLLRASPASDDLSASLSDPARVVNEGRLLARVRHPNVVTVYGAEPRDGAVGLWMEFIRGRTLHQIVEQQGPLGAREAAGAGIDVCRALSAVHGAGLLHRDVTARNVMREDGGRVVLMDFGAGHERQDTLPVAGSDVTGTPLYMAPELFAGARADVRTDIYALGVLMFYLAAGRFPVSGRSLDELRHLHRDGARVRLRDVRADLPAAFVRAVETAVAADPSVRFQTAGALEAALEPALVEGPAIGRASAALPRWQMAAVAATLVTALAGAAWALRPGGDAPPPGAASTVAAAGQLVARRLSLPDGVSAISNPSDDGRFVIGNIDENGDAAIVDLATGNYRALHVGRGDGSDGYASLGALSGDGRLAALDWYNGRDGSLRIVGTDGSAARILIDPPGDVSVYQWSRDGALILAALGLAGGDVLALVAASDGAVRTLASLGTVVPRHAALSPDGRYVVYDAPESDGAIDHDLYVIDVHTGDRWALDPSLGHDFSPFWTGDGGGVVFMSDRNRNPSMWMMPMDRGRPQGAARLIKDNIGKSVVQGLTPGGVLHYVLWAGFAEVYTAALDGSAPPQPISPRQALSNYYPAWSPDGRSIAFASDRGLRGRELWVYDVETGRESRMPLPLPINRPYGWSPDSQAILVGGPDDGRIFTFDRRTNRVTAIASGLERGPSWPPAGIVYDQGSRVNVLDALSGRIVRTFDFTAGWPASRPSLFDGRSLLSRRSDGRLTLHDTATGQARSWQDSGAVSLRVHVLAPHTGAVAYHVTRKDLQGEASSLMVWGGLGEPREILRVHEPVDHFRLVGWTPDGLSLLVIRWSVDAAKQRRVDDETLWRFPLTGGAPVSTGIALRGLRDVSIDPTGRHVTFNAGFRQNEQWVMENLLK